MEHAITVKEVLIFVGIGGGFLLILFVVGVVLTALGNAWKD
jgi:hypothetical protein